MADDDAPTTAPTTDDDGITFGSTTNIMGMSIFILIILVIFMCAGSLIWVGLWRWRKGASKQLVDIDELEGLLDDTENGSSKAKKSKKKSQSSRKSNKSKDASSGGVGGGGGGDASASSAKKKSSASRGPQSEWDAEPRPQSEWGAPGAPGGGSSRGGSRTKSDPSEVV